MEVKGQRSAGTGRSLTAPFTILSVRHVFYCALTHFLLWLLEILNYFAVSFGARTI